MAELLAKDFDKAIMDGTIKSDMVERFKDAIQEADREGKEVYSALVANGVPLIYSIRDKQK